jgi:hypothetical protein
MEEDQPIETTDSWSWGKIVKHVLLPRPKGSPKAGKKETSLRTGMAATFGGLAVLALGWNVILVDSADVQRVKGGSLQSCPHATVDQMVNSFMGSPSWDSGTAENGQKFVNVGGDMTMHDKPVRALVQFMVDPADNTFQFQALEMNGVPQINLLAIGLMNKMCESVGGQ